MSAIPPPAGRVGAHLFGPPLPALGAMWQTGGRRGVTAAICVVLPLVAGTAVHRPDLGAAAALSAFTAIYGHALPYRRRAIVVAGVGAALSLAGGLGALTGHHPVALAVLLGVLAAAATAAVTVWRIGPPGALGVVLVCGGSSALGAATPSAVAVHFLAALAGAALSWCACMLPWLWDPSGPERRAVETAERMVANVERDGPGATRPGAVAAAVRLADVAVADGSRRGREALAARLQRVEQRFFRALPVEHGRRPPTADHADLAGIERWWHVPWVPNAVRIGTGGTAAALVATAVGLHNPYWAATTAVAVQLGIGARGTRARAVQRAAGTVVGVLIAALVIAAGLPVGVQILLVGVMQLTIELLVAHAYGIAVAFITPLVLTLVHIGVPDRPGSELIGERLAETGIGIVIALGIGLTLFPHAASRRLPGAVERASDAAVRAAAEPAEHRRLHDALIGLAEVAAASRAELLPSAGTAAWLRRGRWVADLGWVLLGARARGDGVLTDAVTRRIGEELAPGR